MTPLRVLADIDQCRAMIRDRLPNIVRVSQEGPDGSTADDALVRMLALYAVMEAMGRDLELLTLPTDPAA